MDVDVDVSRWRPSKYLHELGHMKLFPRVVDVWVSSLCPTVEFLSPCPIPLIMPFFLESFL
jgi:hypothetical protein